MVIDRRDIGSDMIDIIHFVAYKEKPTKNDIDSLIEEFKVDKTFGLSDIVEHLLILPAPFDIVEKYKNEFEQDANNL